MSLSFAAGFRNRETGALTNVGTNGYAWSSSPYVSDGSNAYNAGMLNFNSGNVNPLNNGNRAIARAVRCVQASAGRFLEVKGENSTYSGPTLREE